MVLSRPRQEWRTPTRRPWSIIVCIATLLAVPGGALGAGGIVETGAKPPLLKRLDDAALANTASLPLHLEVFINSQPTNLVAAFEKLADGRIAIKAAEMKEIGLKPPSASSDETTVVLDDLANLRYVYDEQKQTISITVSDEARIARRFDLRQADDIKADRDGVGAVVNYNLHGAFHNDLKLTETTFEGGSASLDGWLYSPLGNLSSSGVVSVDGEAMATWLRLETAWTYSDQDALVTYRLGDTISSGPAWSRPVRMGGAQIKRNFALRPDLVTIPLPAVSGSAAVPSTVEVYINNVKAHTQNVTAGPFTIANIPALSASGEASLVVRDAQGREVRTSSPFYSSAKLLRKGLFDFAAEAGVARNAFGIESNNYSDQPFSVASARYGLRDTITLEGHAEMTRNLVLGGLGVTMPVANKILVTAAASGSVHSRGEGVLIYGSLETNFFGLSLSASAQHVFGDYFDIATMSAIDVADPAASLTTIVSGASFPTALDRVSLSLPLPAIAAGATVSFVHTETPAQPQSNILSLTYTQQLFGRATFYATAFADFAELAKPSVFAGLTIPLGGRTTASVGGSHDAVTGETGTVSVSRSLGSEPGDYGWRVRDSEGQKALREAAFAYRSRYARFEGSLTQVDQDLQGSVNAQGALAVAGGGVFLANRINDSFAVVDVGAANVPVKIENRTVAYTDAAGKALVTGLRSYERNKISFDPANLPVDAAVPTTRSIVVPAERNGIKVDFGVKTDSASAVVIFVTADGKPVETAAPGRLVDGGEFIVGYDGRAFIEGLKGDNEAEITLEGGSCKARFAFNRKAGEQTVIGPVTCQ